MASAEGKELNMSYENILFEVKDGVALVTFNRPKALNAMNPKTLAELDDALEAVRKDEAVRVLVLTGSGEKAFVAGADITEFQKMGPLDARQFAATASCHQDIAGESAFALAMLARYDDIGPARPWLYRQRFWEAGMLGQTLYLEAEAAGLQGTGIGCYFDDEVHRALGVDTGCFQDIYHFTVGKAVADARVGSEPPYVHLGAARRRI